MTVVQMHDGWQGGPCAIEVDGDCIASGPNGEDINGVVLRIETEADLGSGDTFTMELGAGSAALTIRPPGSATLSFAIAGTDAQIRELITALEEAMAMP